MQTAITQQDITVYSSDPLGTKERPSNPYYVNGVDVGYTAPAKWWNWLWNKLTSILTQAKADRTNMLAEMYNVLSSASITPSASDNHQLSKAVNTVEYNTIEAYDNAEEDGHKINQPYVVGYTLYIPDTELL